MNKDEVLERLCTLCSDVAGERFKWGSAADCFCKSNVDLSNFRFDEEVLEFIEAAVKEKLNENK